MAQGCSRCIGDGKDTRVWQVPWLLSGQNGYLTSGVFPELEHATVNSLMSINGNTWDEDILNKFCNERDKALIQQVPIPMRQKPDSWFWLPETKGDFSVRSCYRLLQGLNVKRESSGGNYGV